MPAGSLAHLPPAWISRVRYALFRVVSFRLDPERILFARAMPINPNEFLHYLDGLDLSEGQKVELIHNVAAFMESVIDQEFGTHPVQMAMAARARRDSNGPKAAVNSSQSVLLEPFNRFAARTAKRKAREQ